MSGNLTLPGLPAPLRAINEPEHLEVVDGALSLRAGPRTDWFIDPARTAVADEAPAIVMPAEGLWMLRAHVSAEHTATFDAAVLVVYADDQTWAKLCLELSPQGEVMVVSVVTRGDSDDCNSVPIDGGEIWLRVSHLGRAFAFHASSDGERWDMIRYFGLGQPASVEVGFLAQSPTGSGCTATFRDITFVSEQLADVRSGV